VLRELRVRSRMLVKWVCRRLEFSPAGLSRMENGQTAPDVLVVKGMLDEYGIPFSDWEPYLELAREAQQKGLVAAARPAATGPAHPAAARGPRWPCARSGRTGFSIRMIR
jgi:transcriptional regulator with XRE-family HTH domain